MASKNGMRPVHPGEVLREDFLIPSGMSANALHVPTPRINDVVLERRGITWTPLCGWLVTSVETLAPG